MFADPKACLALVEDLRWPNGFICPECGQRCEPWRGSRSRLVCPICRHQGSATAGTPLDRTRTPLLTWFKVAWYLANGSNAIPVTEMSKRLGVRYRSTWEMFHLFRVVMGRCYRKKLEGTVLAVVKSVRTLETQGRPVLIAVEVADRNGGGEVRLCRLDSTSEEDLVSGIQKIAVPGSTVVPSWVQVGSRLEAQGYRHLLRFGSQPDSPSAVSEGIAFRHAAILSPKIPQMVRDDYLQSHLDEVGYRFNRRAVQNPGLRFRDLLRELMTTDCRRPDLVGFSTTNRGA